MLLSRKEAVPSHENLLLFIIPLPHLIIILMNALIITFAFQVIQTLLRIELITEIESLKKLHIQKQSPPFLKWPLVSHVMLSGIVCHGKNLVDSVAKTQTKHTLSCFSLILNYSAFKRIFAFRAVVQKVSIYEREVYRVIA